jgi:hypothetical protein
MGDIGHKITVSCVAYRVISAEIETSENNSCYLLYVPALLQLQLLNADRSLFLRQLFDEINRRSTEQVPNNYRTSTEQMMKLL